MSEGPSVDPVPGPSPERIDVGRIVGRYVPIVRWLPTYDRADLRFDAIAGLVSWGVMVPVAMAYAGLAGMPPETGLVTAFAALSAYAVFGTSRHIKVTTSSSVAIMSASVVAAIAAGNVAYYIESSAALAIVVGIILMVAGAAPARLPRAVPCRLGRDRVRHRSRVHDHRRAVAGPPRPPCRRRHDRAGVDRDHREP